MYCAEGSLVKRENREVAVAPLFCRSWGCSECGPKRRQELIGQAAAGHPNTLITLTVNPAWGSSPEDRARSLADAWRRIVRRAKKHYGYDRIPYFAVFEATKKGEPHLHILARVKWLDQKWLSAQMAELMAAPNVDIRRVYSPRRAASYVSKYIGKDPQRFGTCKRYWSTQDWNLYKEEQDRKKRESTATWEIKPQSAIEIVKGFDPARWYTDLSGEWWILTPRPPPDYLRV